MDGLPALMTELARDYPFLEAGWIDRIARAYGTRARAWLGAARALNDLGTHFGHGLTAAEVDYLAAQEWARSAQDVLWRRTKLGLWFDARQVAALDAHLAKVTDPR
jgi:glycerol-3-phosphate dehydrogenase